MVVMNVTMQENLFKGGKTQKAHRKLCRSSRGYLQL